MRFVVLYNSRCVCVIKKYFDVATPSFMVNDYQAAAIVGSNIEVFVLLLKALKPGTEHFLSGQHHIAII